MTNFIKLEYTEFLEDFKDTALFLGEIATDQIFHPYNVKQIERLLTSEQGTVCPSTQESLAENILPFFESIGYSEKDIAELFNTCLVGNDPDDYETAEEFEEENEINLMDAINFDLPDFINNMFYYIECERNKKGEDLTEKFLNYLGLEAFTVGYSPWSLVVTSKDSDREFYEDLWNGWNFYNIVVTDKYGEFEDVIGGLYIRNDQELREAVSDYFGFDSFKLIDNEEADAFNVPKAKAVTTYE